jgi:hypothetical protein
MRGLFNKCRSEIVFDNVSESFSNFVGCAPMTFAFHNWLHVTKQTATTQVHSRSSIARTKGKKNYVAVNFIGKSCLTNM